MYNWSTLKKLICLYAAKLKGGAQATIETITGNLPLVLQNAIQHSIKSLTRYGLCTQDGTPTPDNPVDILYNNGAIKYGWHDIITTSQLNGYGTYVSPSQVAGNRAYRWLKDLPNGTYQLTVDGDYEIIVQWRDPADPIAYPITSVYENLTGWMTSGVVTLDKTSGGYGLVVKRTSGTDSITPSNFDGTLHVQEQGIYVDGTSEVLTVSGPNLLNAATNITGYYIGSNGSITAGSDAQYTDLIPVKAGETYVCSLVSGRNSGTNRWHGYDANGVWVKQLANVSASGQQGARPVILATIDSGISYVRLSYGIADTEAMIQWAPLSGEIIADGFYSGKMASSTPMAYRNAPIESPYTSTSNNSGPAMIFSISPGKTYAVKDDIVTNYTSIYYGCYANIEDVAYGAKAISKGNGNLFVAPNGANYAVVLYSNSNSGTTFTFGEPSASEYQSQADYQPYVPPQTASVPTLLSVEDVKDEVELIAGTYTHRCAACEYDGTQDVGDTYLSTTGGKDIGAIIVYPLSTPTTEQITAQNLVTNEGTNIVDSVANVSPLEANVKYMAASAQNVLSTLFGIRVTPKDISTQDAEDMINIITGEDNK